MSTFKTPGVYINEVNAFPNSVVPVATAIPAFVGYTPQASYEGKSYLNVPFKVTSFNDFKAVYCWPDLPAPAQPTKQYIPQYYLAPQLNPFAGSNTLAINNKIYSIVPDVNTIYYMYNSIRLFYENGGCDAYIVSVGIYGEGAGHTPIPGSPLINANVKLNDLQNGLKLLLNEPEPTMYICPDATLLSSTENTTLMQSMLLQSETMQTAICILDVPNGNNPNPELYINDIEKFRESTGTKGLDYGTAYYPFIGTTIMNANELDYTNLFGGDVKQLAAIINPANNLNPAVTAILNIIEQQPNTPANVSQYNNALAIASPAYQNILTQVLTIANILPPCGAMAGVMTTIDNTEGVWNSPANVSIVGCVSLPINLSESQQASLNIDALSGKSINAIRSFNSIGILVWGARTLDGNNDDCRYISVRRTIIMIEQSCKMAAQAYVFQPNDKNTWEAVKSMLGDFLTSIWKQGGLMGAAPADAFSVDCGLGSTMTSDDILNGYMNVAIKVAIVHPAEFIVLTFQQQMAAST
jgi:phage tail sheath protein FI